MVDIVIIRSNSIINNPRVSKIAGSLSKRYSTSVLGWNRDNFQKKKIKEYGLSLKLLKFGAPFGKPSLVAYFPIYWAWVLFQLIFILRPKVIHACDLDSAIPSYIYKNIARRRLVFDVCDRYAMGYIPPRFKTLYAFVNSLEELIGKNSDVLVNVSEKLLETFKKRPKSCAVIMNCSKDHTVNILVRKKEMTTMRVVYTGNVTRNRGLLQMTTAIKELEGVEFIMAGRDMDKKLLDELLSVPNVSYVGLLNIEESWELQANSDAMVSLYDPGDPISYYSMGNKIFEAMTFGVPVITNVAEEVISEAQCGILVDYNDINQIKNAVICLRDDIELRKRLSRNGRSAFLKKYNWQIMERRLYAIYDELLGNSEAELPKAIT